MNSMIDLTVTNFYYYYYYGNELSDVIIQQWRLSKAKLNYHFISIFGSQSTGKSK